MKKKRWTRVAGTKPKECPNPKCHEIVKARKCPNCGTRIGQGGSYSRYAKIK